MSGCTGPVFHITFSLGNLFEGLVITGMDINLGELVSRDMSKWTVSFIQSKQEKMLAQIFIISF